MHSARSISIIAIFTSLIIASDYALVSIPNVKLVFTLTFASAYSFGFKIGASIAVLSELIWGIVTPYGFGGLIIPFLAGANLIYAFAGWGASKIWGGNVAPVSYLNVIFGAILAICAFLWDLVTNFGTALIFWWPSLTLPKFLITLGAGVPFMVFHELGDFVIGSSLAPIVIVYFRRLSGQRNILLKSPVKTPQSAGCSSGRSLGN